MAIEAVLCHVIEGDRILLKKGAEGTFGQGRWNGPGGRLRKRETPGACAVREVLEETGIQACSLRLHGKLSHFFGEGAEPDWVVHVYSTCEFEGEPREGGEGELRWFPLDEIPYGEMWPDDEHWLPLLLEGKRFEGEFHFNQEGTELLEHRLAPHE